ncbi:MAG: hypothetical protein WC756_14435 [Taibaiella sp.]|jgi:hypothetical protein
MKKIFQLALVCAGIGIVAASTSCSSVYDATPSVPGRDTIKNALRGNFTATVDGVEFVANAKYASDQTVDGIRTITISGVMDSKIKDPKTNQSISLSITNYEGPKTYPIQFGTAGVYVVQEDGVYTTYLAKTGDTMALINITKDQGDLEGTFNFVVAPNGMGTANNHSIYNGTFSVPK